MSLEVHVIEASSDPVGAPAFVGQHWINTSNGKQWLANGTGSVSDWAQIFTSSVLDEQVRDVVAATVQDSSSIDFTNNDAGDTMSLAVIPGGVDHNSLANLTTGNPHTQYLQTSVAASTYQPLDSDLTAVAGLAGTGLVTRTGTGAATTRTITSGTGITVTNGDGVAGNPTIVANVGAIDHDGLLNFVANEHVNHASVSINAGTYLSGGGDITATRTINHANSTVTAATYGGVNAIPVLGIGATGHVDSASTVNPTAALLTGLAAGTDTPILATDTLLVALANLQAQVDALLATDNEWIELNTASTYTNTSNTTGVNVTELALSITNGRKYYYEATLLYQTAATGTGLAVTVTSPDGGSAPGAVMVNMTVAGDGTAATYAGTINSLGDYVTGSGTQTANTPFVCHMKGNFPANASGTFNITFRSEVNGSQVTILPGSTLLVREFV